MSALSKILNNKNVSVVQVFKLDATYLIEIDNQEWSVSENKCIKYKSGKPTDDFYKISLKDFYSRFVAKHYNPPENHFKNWTKTDHDLLIDLITDDYKLIDAANILKRNMHSVFLQAKIKKWIEPDKNFKEYTEEELEFLKFTDIGKEDESNLNEYYDTLNNYQLPI